MKITLDITFSEEVEDEAAVIGNISDALRHCINHGNGIRPEDSDSITEQIIVSGEGGYAQVYDVKKDIIESL